MAHAIRGGENRRESTILSKALLFWAAFAILGIAGFYGIDRVVDPSADLANLALPNDGQLEGGWTSGPLRLQAALHDSTMIVDLSRSQPHSQQIATFLLDRGAKTGPIGFRHHFQGGPDGEIGLSLSGSVLVLDLPATDGRPRQRLAFRRS